MVQLCRTWRDWPRGIVTMGRRPGLSALKLVGALSALAVVGSLPAENWPALVAVLAVTWGALAVAGISGRTLRRRGRQFAPLAIGLAAATGISQPHAAAGLWLAVTCLRCFTAMAVGLWLVQVLSAREFLRLLSWCRLPPVFVTMVSFLLRYVVLAWEEHERLRLAQLARAGGPQSGWANWRAAIERVGLLLIRALDRAERTHRALCARGWDGTATWTE
uniref:Cobalt ECF transporter T component CbiQ n=1 Tax=Schlesneria paludicola TaxID=360056 RepID=A0A7C4LMJ7_9PLAN